MAKVLDQVYLEAIANDAIKNRKIWLNEVVDEQSCTKVIYFLEKIKRSDQVLNGVFGKKRKKEPITIVCNSPGGLCYQGFMLYSHIRTMVEEGYDIITLTGGMSASMSFMIGLAGSTRKCYKHSSFLCHQPSGGAIGTALEIKREYVEIHRIWDRMVEIIKERTKFTDEDIARIYGTAEDYILSAEEALEKGVVDEII